MIALPPARDHLLQQLRRVLEVGIHYHYCTASRELHTRGNRRLVAEIPREVNGAEARVAHSHITQQSFGSIPAAIVDQEHFCRAAELR
jgi:hypothetical protein